MLSVASTTSLAFNLAQLRGLIVLIAVVQFAPIKDRMMKGVRQQDTQLKRRPKTIRGASLPTEIIQAQYCLVSHTKGHSHNKIGPSTLTRHVRQEAQALSQLAVHFHSKGLLCTLIVCYTASRLLSISFLLLSLTHNVPLYGQHSFIYKNACSHI